MIIYTVQVAGLENTKVDKVYKMCVRQPAKQLLNADNSPALDMCL